MPKFDGTGPRGQGPMTGRAEGYCALVLPSPGSGTAPYGYAGLRGTPVQLGAPGGRAGAPAPQAQPGRTGGGPGMMYPYRASPPVAGPLTPLDGTRGGRGLGRRRGWRGGRRG